MTRNTFIIGITLIAVAIVLLLGKLGVFALLGRLFWPLLILGIGLVLHALYYMRMAPAGILIPGGALVVYSFIFLFCNLFGWGFMKYLWPGFIFGVSAGLYEYYRLDRYSSAGVYKASFILAVISALLFAAILLFSLHIYVLIAVLMAAGIGFIFWRPKT